MKKTWKMVSMWIFGTVFIMAGSMISGHVEKSLGVTELSFFMALLISFVLFLIGGLLWISVGIAVKRTSEE